MFDVYRRKIIWSGVQIKHDKLISEQFNISKSVGEGDDIFLYK